MKVAVSIPDDLFESGERVSKRLGVTRSRLYATALAEYIAKTRDRKLTERLNLVYRACRRPVAGGGEACARQVADRAVVVERGLIWWANLGEPDGAEPGKTGQYSWCKATHSTAVAFTP